MAQSNIPKLGYPCLASTDASVFLVGLQYAPSASNNTYALQSYSVSNDRHLASVNVTFAPLSTPRVATPLANSRMVCAVDNVSGTFLYIFNENVYLDNALTPALATPQPIGTWDATLALNAQVAWPVQGQPGQFQWLGLNGGNWTTMTISAAGGVSPPIPA